MKRILAIVFIVILIAAIGSYIYFQKTSAPVGKEVSNYKAVPIDAPVFFEINSLGNFPYKNKIFSSLNNAGFFTQFFRMVANLDSIISINFETASSRNDPFIIAMNLEGKDNYIPLIIAKAETGSKKNNLETLVSKMYPSVTYNSRKREYNSENIYDLNSGNPNESFSYSFTRGLFIASPKSLVVEKAIRQLDTEGLQNDAGFIQINKTAAQQAQASIYINHKFFPAFIKSWVNPTVTKSIDEFGSEVKTNYRSGADGFSDFAAWSELDLTSKDNDLHLYGVSAVPDSVGHYITIFKRQDALKVQIDRAMPANASLFYSLAFSNRKNFFEDLQIYFTHSDTYYAREEKLKKIETQSQADLRSVFENITDDEIALAFINVPGDPLQKNTCFIISTKGKSQAKEEMGKWFKKYVARNGTTLSKMVGTYKIDRETKFEIYAFPFPSFPGIWLGKPFNSASANFFAYFDDYIIFANTRPTLESVLHDLSRESTLSKDPDYILFKQNTEAKANLTFYLNVGNGYNLNKEYLSEDIAKRFKTKDAYLRKFGSLYWQVANTNNLLFNNIYLNYSEGVKENAKTAWQSNIGATLASKPLFVVDLSNKKKNDILAQDINNVLHLVTGEGKPKWAVPLPEKIIGEIQPVELRKNGDTQFLFNTKSKIYLIDRQGNNVPPYPVALRSPATNEIEAVDFENNKNYTFFIACEDKKVYAYDSSGKPLQGWGFGKTDQVVTIPVQYFKADGKDYIVFKDKSRFYFLDRKGKSKLNIPVRFENSQNPVVFNKTGVPKLVVTNTKGTIYYLFFNGKVSTKKMPEMSGNHFFTATDLDGNGILDFVFADKDMLTVTDEKGSMLFSTKFNGNISFLPEVYQLSPKLKVLGVVCQNENRVYLFNPDGTIHAGFPVKGFSKFNIGQLTQDSKGMNLITGSSDGKIFNYKLD
jgi:hypothetical protein